MSKQEARRIFIAEYQHISYQEWLPIIIGEDFMNDWGLRVDENSTFKHRYDPVSEEIQPLMRNRGISAMVNYGIVWGGGNLVEG